MMKRVLPFLFLCLCLRAAPLGAVGDPLAGVYPSLSEGPSFQVTLTQHIYERDYWYHDESVQLSSQSIYPLAGYDSQKGIDLTLGLHWQATRHQALELLVPYRYVEFSPPRLLNDQPFAPGQVISGDHLGDLLLRHRLLLWEGHRREYGAWAGWINSLSLPTGAGPFSAPHPFVASGQGTLVATTGLHALEKAGDLRLWQELDGSWAFGYQGTVPAGYPLEPLSDGSVATLAGGPAYIKPGNSLRFLGGVMADLIHSADGVYSVGGEISATVTQSLQLGGRDVPDTNLKSIDLYPQFKADFAPRFFVEGGVLYSLVLVHQLGAGPDWYEPIFRIGYAF